MKKKIIGWLGLCVFLLLLWYVFFARDLFNAYIDFAGCVLVLILVSMASFVSWCLAVKELEKGWYYRVFACFLFVSLALVIYLSGVVCGLCVVSDGSHGYYRNRYYSPKDRNYLHDDVETTKKKCVSCGALASFVWCACASGYVLLKKK